MDKKEYDNLLAKAEEKYRKALESASKERSEALFAIEKVWGMLQEPQEKRAINISRIPIKILPAQKNNSKPYGSLIVGVKDTLERMPRKFTKNHIKKDLKKWSNLKNVNNSSLSGCLARLQKKRIIEVILKGEGRRPTVYRRGITGQLLDGL